MHECGREQKKLLPAWHPHLCLYLSLYLSFYLCLCLYLSFYLCLCLCLDGSHEQKKLLPPGIHICLKPGGSHATFLLCTGITFLKYTFSYTSNFNGTLSKVKSHQQILLKPHLSWKCCMICMFNTPHLHSGRNTVI